MRLLLAVCAFLFLLAFSPPAHAKLVSRSVDVNGHKRTYRLYMPKAYNGKSNVALVIVLHGGAGCGWSAEYDSRMSAQAEKDSFICAYPNGFWRSWNADGCCGPAQLKRIDDVAFIRAMIEQCKSRVAVDPDRIYVAGFSNGGMLAYKLGVELPDEIAAIAPVEGCMYPSDAQNVVNMPVSVVAVHGTDDRVVRPAGGTGALLGYKVTAQSISDTLNYWVARDNCGAFPIHEETDTISKDLYTGGNDGTEVCLYTVKNSGHVWPGGRQCLFAGDRPRQDWSATEAICQFFWAHPKHKFAADAN